MAYRILIADDESDIRSVLRLYMEAAGFEVVEAADGQEALDALAAQQIDLCLLDIMMPVLDGYHVLKRIRETSDLPVIVISAKGQDPEKILGLNLGADDYMVKPFNPLEAVARVNHQAAALRGGLGRGLRRRGEQRDGVPQQAPRQAGRRPAGLHPHNPRHRLPAGEVMSMAERGNTAADLSTEKGTSDLIAYLVVRFILVLLAVMAVEQVVVMGEGLVIPALERFAGMPAADALGVGESFFAVLARLLRLLGDAVRIQQTLGAGRAAAVSSVVLLMLLTLIIPPFLGALVFSRMVVHRVRALQERREAELAQIDQQRSQFITDIAHDLRTPLMAISGMAHAISDGVVRDDATRDEYVRSIGEKADKMGGLVSSVFEYTKLGGGSFSLEREDLELPELLLREAAAVYTDMEDAGMTFSVQVPEDRCTVHADPVQLARVVANLLVNALRHNQAGAEIALMLVRRAGVAYVIVADTGEPIPGTPDDLFQPFVRGDAARRSTGDSGLGLSICRRIAEMHGYDLSLVQPYGRFTKAFVLQCAVV